jgi:hypothetical protein
MKFLIITLIIMMTSGAYAFKNKKLNPIIQEPTMPGTTVPVEDLRTSPNPTPAELESDKSRATLQSQGKQEQQDAVKENEGGDQEQSPQEN